jgi:hypothetical protein
MLPSRNRTSVLKRQRSCSSAGGALGRIRRAHGLVQAGLMAFVVGFIAAPCWHNVSHRPDHHHDEGGLVSVVHEHPHPHPHPHGDRLPGSTREAPALGDPTSPVVDRPSDELPLPGHGHGSMAHFGVAVTPVAVFVVPPPAVSAEEPPFALPETSPPRPWIRGLPPARGPPAV